MADIAVAVQDIVEAGLTPSYTGSLVATTNTYQVRLDGRVFIHLKKSGAGSCDAVFETPRTIRGKAVADLTVTVPASTGDKMVGPFNQEDYADTDGLLNIVFSETTGLTIAALRLP